MVQQYIPPTTFTIGVHKLRLLTLFQVLNYLVFLRFFNVGDSRQWFHRLRKGQFAMEKSDSEPGMKCDESGATHGTEPAMIANFFQSEQIQVKLPNRMLITGFYSTCCTVHHSTRRNWTFSPIVSVTHLAQVSEQLAALSQRRSTTFFGPNRIHVKLRSSIYLFISLGSDGKTSHIEKPTVKFAGGLQHCTRSDFDGHHTRVELARTQHYRPVTSFTVSVHKLRSAYVVFTLLCTGILKSLLRRIAGAYEATRGLILTTTNQR